MRLERRRETADYLNFPFALFNSIPRKEIYAMKKWFSIIIVSAIFLIFFCRKTSAETAAEIAKRSLPSVVLITIYDSADRPISSGSGFVIDNEKVATAYHVVAGGVSATVKTADKIVYPVSCAIVADAGKDLAILQVKKMTDVPSLPLGDSSEVVLGESLVAIGSPLGLEGTITEGIVSAIRESPEYKTEVIQYSAPTSPGNSGGPIVNSRGEVVGIISHQMRSGQNLNFAIPVKWLKIMLSQPTQSINVSTLGAPILSEIGTLPSKKKQIEMTVPKKPPFTLYLDELHRWDKESAVVSIDRVQLRKVASAVALELNTFSISSTGVFTFHEKSRGKKAKIEYEYTPYRIALFILTDGTSQLESVLLDRLNRSGDEIIGGAEVQAAVKQWAPQIEEKWDFRQLAQQLNCGGLIVAQCLSQDNGNWAEVAVSLAIYDLNTGSKLAEKSGGASILRDPWQSWSSVRRRALNKALDSMSKPL
jgi:hypothetical protein